MLWERDVLSNKQNLLSNFNTVKARRFVSVQPDQVEHNRLPITIMMELVVWSQSGQSTGADAVREEDLGSAVYPRSRIEQLLPSWRHVVKQTVVGTLQRHRSSQKNEKHHVREQGWKPDDLTALMKTATDDKVNEQPADNQAA